jgi:ubiquitin-conjugating enzyme E2 J2
MDPNNAITIRRLKGEIKKLNKNRESYYQVVQDKVDPLLFYFLLRGDESSDYKGGYYIGKITLPETYPLNPGDIYMLTPSGRFKVDSKICLTNSGYHKDMWSPMWNIQNMVIGFTSVFLSDDTKGISHIRETPELRIQKAQNSINYNMAHNREIFMMFDQFVNPDGTVKSSEEVDKYICDLQLQRKQKKRIKNTI